MRGYVVRWWCIVLLVVVGTILLTTDSSLFVAGKDIQKGDSGSSSSQQQEEQKQKKEDAEEKKKKTADSKGNDSGESPAQPSRWEDMDDEDKRKVITLTSRNFGSSVNDGNVWLIEFYAPWCGHCTTFATSYSEVAKQLHGELTGGGEEKGDDDDDKRRKKTKKRKRGVKVAKINADAERALASRFAIRAYPSFFILDGWEVYRFEGERTKRNLISYAKGGYKRQSSPIPFYESPMGPVGQAQGTILYMGFVLSDIFQWVQTTFGLTQLLAGIIIFGSMFLGCFVLIVCLALAIPPKVKLD